MTVVADIHGLYEPAAVCRDANDLIKMWVLHSGSKAQNKLGNS